MSVLNWWLLLLYSYKYIFDVRLHIASTVPFWSCVFQNFQIKWENYSQIITGNIIILCMSSSLLVALHFITHRPYEAGSCHSIARDKERAERNESTFSFPLQPFILFLLLGAIYSQYLYCLSLYTADLCIQKMAHFPFDSNQ